MIGVGRVWVARGVLLGDRVMRVGGRVLVFVVGL